MRIGVVGAGRIGGGAARLLAQAGHEILLSYSRDTRRLHTLAEELGDRVTVGEVADAVRFGEVVLLSVPWRLLPDVLAAAGSLDGKIVIDTTNQFSPGGLDPVPAGTTAARVNAERMPGARLVKTFNTLTAGFQQAASHRPGEPAVLFLCGDDRPAKEIVAGLIEDAGFAPCDLGGLDDAGPMEAPRRPGAVYGEEYRPADAEAARRALALGQPLPPTPHYEAQRG